MPTNRSILSSLVSTQLFWVWKAIGKIVLVSLRMHAKIANRTNGQVAQLVEQWTENPRAEGSSPPLTTMIIQSAVIADFFIV